MLLVLLMQATTTPCILFGLLILRSAQNDTWYVFIRNDKQNAALLAPLAVISFPDSGSLQHKQFLPPAHASGKGYCFTYNRRMTDQIAAIIVAAGKSQRMGGADKQLRTVGGVPVLARTIAAFEDCQDVGAIILVLNPDNMAGATEMSREFGWRKVKSIVPGGERRQDSVGAGLSAVADMARHGMEYGWVAVHDGARPLLTPGLISRGLEAARAGGAAIAALPATDTIKQVDADGIITGTPERESLWLAQTPQIFRTDILVGAYSSLAQSGDDSTATDCSRLVEMMGHPVAVFTGEPTNIKITTPLDLILAEAILRGH